ncbi:Cytochrome c oxidase subunit 5b-2 protein [Thalictrum thalictroides]|uniref:Cytochrome c oxidase subunit 5b-2 protein n=1 Tax=Thalictrum thalictroides TaxID=46969 RepID=A0A7J6W006_THATH|nr:Cytochrome c oxidase subunit 5b-2 protein [Thalictrum thalictroides]
MWRRVTNQLQQTLIRCRSDLKLNRSVPIVQQISTNGVSSSNPISFYRPSFLFTYQFSSDADTILSKGKTKVEEVMPIATGHEREELEAVLEGRDLLDINHPVGPFGTKEKPAVIKAYFDRRVVGCPGGEGEDEHDVVWFWLEKGKTHECPVCTQVFTLEVVGPGGPPDGHGDDDDNHH